MTAAGASGVAELARARAGVFGLLARIFGSQPSLELVRAMRDKKMLGSLEAFGVSFAEDFLAGDEELLVEDLRREYTRLFVGPGTHIAANESVYVRGEGDLDPQLWGAATVAVAEFYRELGLELPEGRTPDHLSLELEAMAVMAKAQADRLQAGDEKGAEEFGEMQKRFCEEHLLLWIPAVCGDVELKTVSSFYRSVAALTAALVRLSCGAQLSGNVQEEEALNEDP